MINLMSKSMSYFVLITIGFSFTRYFYANSFVYHMVAAGVAITILISLYYSSNLPKVFSVIMLLAGVVILLVNGVPYAVWEQSMLFNLPIISLILLVPLLAIPITSGGYSEQVQRFTLKFSDKPSLLYLAISSTFFILGPVLNLASIRVLDAMISKLGLPVNFLTKVYVRGFSSVLTWSPYFASIFIVVYYLEVPLSKILPLGLLLGIGQFLLGYTLFMIFDRNKFELPRANKVAINKKKLTELVLVVFLITGIIFVLEHFLDVNMMIIITLTVISVAFLWSLYLKEISQFNVQISRFSHSILPFKANEITLFLISGFFGSALSYTPVGYYLRDLLTFLSYQSVFLLIISTIFIISFFAFIGIHQIVTVSAIISIVSAGDLGVTTVVLALVFLSAWSISTMVSPVGATNISITTLLNVKMTDIIFKHNFYYVIGTLVLHSTMIYVLYVLI